MEKPASDFSRSSYQRTGLRSWCKECSSKSKKQAKAEGRWKSYDLKAKVICNACKALSTCGQQLAEASLTTQLCKDSIPPLSPMLQGLSYFYILVQQPRKCRKCDELRPPEDFPIDPRNASKRTRDCQYCLSDLGDMPPGAQGGMEGPPVPVGGWGHHHLGEYWQIDPARSVSLSHCLRTPPAPAL